MPLTKILDGSTLIFYVSRMESKRKQMEAVMAFHKIVLKAVAKTSDITAPVNLGSKLLVVIDMLDNSLVNSMEEDVRKLKKSIPKVCIVVLSEVENEIFVTRLLQAGVCDYVLGPMEDLNLQLFIQKLKAFQEHQVWQPNLLLQIMQRYSCFLEKMEKSNEIIATFDVKRTTIFELLIQGKSERDMQRYFEKHSLGIGEHGIRDHKRAILEAFKVRKHIQLLALLYAALKNN